MTASSSTLPPDPHLVAATHNKLFHLGVNIKLSWLQQLAEHINTHQHTQPLPHNPLSSVASFSRLAYEYMLYADLSSICLAALPANLHAWHKQILTGQYVLQVTRCVDVGQRQEETDDNSHNNHNHHHHHHHQHHSHPLWKLALTDGHQVVVCILLSVYLNPLSIGCKVAVRDVMIRRGVLILHTDKLAILGGEAADNRMPTSALYNPSPYASSHLSVVSPPLSPLPPLEKPTQPSSPEQDQEKDISSIQESNNTQTKQHRLASSYPPSFPSLNADLNQYDDDDDDDDDDARLHTFYPQLQSQQSEQEQEVNSVEDASDTSVIGVANRDVEEEEHSLDHHPHHHQSPFVSASEFVQPRINSHPTQYSQSSLHSADSASSFTVESRPAVGYTTGPAAPEPNNPHKLPKNPKTQTHGRGGDKQELDDPFILPMTQTPHTQEEDKEQIDKTDSLPDDEVGKSMTHDLDAFLTMNQQQNTEKHTRMRLQRKQAQPAAEHAQMQYQTSVAAATASTPLKSATLATVKEQPLSAVREAEEVIIVGAEQKQREERQRQQLPLSGVRSSHMMCARVSLPSSAPFHYLCSVRDPSPLPVLSADSFIFIKAVLICTVSFMSAPDYLLTVRVDDGTACILMQLSPLLVARDLFLCEAPLLPQTMSDAEFDARRCKAERCLSQLEGMMLVGLQAQRLPIIHSIHTPTLADLACMQQAALQRRKRATSNR